MLEKGFLNSFWERPEDDLICTFSLWPKERTGWNEVALSKRVGRQSEKSWQIGARSGVTWLIRDEGLFKHSVWQSVFPILTVLVQTHFISKANTSHSCGQRPLTHVTSNVCPSPDSSSHVLSSLIFSDNIINYIFSLTHLHIGLYFTEVP